MFEIKDFLLFYCPDFFGKVDNLIMHELNVIFVEDDIKKTEF